jgi:hypothetical protein
MEIENTALYSEVVKVTTNTSLPVHYRYDAVLYPVDDGGSYSVIKVVALDINQDFEGKYGDELLLKALIGAGKYAYHIYPYKDNIDVVIIKTPLTEVGDQVDASSPMTVKRYRGILIDTGSPTMTKNGSGQADEQSMDIANIVEIHFQLLDKALEKLRYVDAGGTLRYTTVEDALKGMMTSMSQSVTVDKKTVVLGVDMVKASNATQRTSIVIKHGIPIVHLPAYFQKECGGVYNAGMGHYYMDGIWYLYPCYDVTRFNSTTRTAVIINLPENRFPHIERTYRKDANNLVILATGKIQHQDKSSIAQMNLGNGARYTDAAAMLTSAVTVKNNKALISRGAFNSEYTAQTRSDGANYAPVSGSTINANPFEEMSKLAKRMGGVMAIEWQNSNPDLLTPGMMVRILYLENDQINQLDGVLLKAHTYVHQLGDGIMGGRHSTNTGLSVFVKPVSTSS